uniref:Uncharacterized protein n=1 Tax=Utricularia reniformis TaxID=192314 RepID=A0A1Y0B0G9_9LAMI|nr:hypothetical protein AEK19_MT0640 [Utricularia reniformis]ART30893.1 hypothetical protein AEK19_MT0640 [Utricularia reniformis]
MLVTYTPPQKYVYLLMFDFAFSFIKTIDPRGCRGMSQEVPEL